VISPNALYLCDCLSLLERVDSEKITLVYLDPPFFGEDFVDSKKEPPRESRWTASEYSESFQDYLDIIGKVIQQTRRILTQSGSLYIHSEPHLSSYVRLLLDQIFGRDNYMTDFILPAHRYGKINRRPSRHEVILLYSKSGEVIYNPPKRILKQDEIQEKYNLADEKGPFLLSDLTLRLLRPDLVYEWKGILPPTGRSWRFRQERMEELHKSGLIYYSKNRGLPALKTYAGESKEVEIGNIWDDLSLALHKTERTNFISQRPMELLKRIILAGSNEDDIILDPFCGSGTSLVAAHETGRKWIGCDISREAYSISLARMDKTFALKPGRDYVAGDQTDVTRSSAYTNPYVSLLTGLKKFAQETTQPIIYVEGKTDREILLTAWNKLYGNNPMPFGIKDCNLLPEESEDIVAGASILGKFISTVRADNPHVAIGLFDRDKEGSDEYRSLPKYFTEIPEVEAKVSLNRKCAALLLPVPAGKELYSAYLNFSIEFYFGDTVLSQSTPEGWGLKFRYPEIETKIKRHGNPIIRVETSRINETREIIEGKTIFAERIAPQLAAIEFEPFRVLFEHILNLIKYLSE